MKEPFSVVMEVKDADGKLVQRFEQLDLGYEPLVAVQEAVTAAFVALGKAGVALKARK